MTNEQKERREEVINGIAEMLRSSSFSFEYKVVKRPKGIKVIAEVTQEQMEAIMAEMGK